MTERDMFEAALELPPENRVGYLDGACGGDSSLRQRLEALLGKHERAGDFLERPAAQIVVTVDEMLAERPGTVIGPYKLLEQIGEGGMGLVYVAEQHEPIKRRVALKIIKPGMDSRQVIARFEAERQALALMDHPHIAKVHDGGTTPEGRPYFVMELVKGTPITDYCDRHRLTTRQRLQLFLDVCQAVQHAHQKGIIHRDLKPSNVLVEVHDVHPVVKVIDFGIAKAMGQQLTDKTVYIGMTQMIGTPMYMSPEQAGLSSLDVDTRSDVYSLGVLLYELLTGTTPFDSETLKKADYDEMRRIIRENEPPRPSTRLSTIEQAALSTIAEKRGLEPRRLSQQLRGELDWIVMKALEKDRNRRYESASAFAADVQRFLHDEPVQACPPSSWYKIKKYTRRHRRPLATAAAFLVLLVLGSGISIWQAVRTAERAEGERLAKETAQRRLAQIEKVNEILGTIFKDVDPQQEEKEAKPLRALLGERLDQAMHELEGEAVGDPLAVAKLQVTLGNCQLGLGYTEKAIVLFKQALAGLSVEAGPEHPDAIACAEGLFRAYSRTGQLRNVLPWFEETYKQASAKLGQEHLATLAYMDNLAWVYHYLNKFDQSISLFDETVKLRTATLGPEHRDTLKSMNGLAMVCRSARKTDRAIEVFEKAFHLQKATLGPDHRDTLHSMHHLAWSYLQGGKREQGVKLFEEELKLLKAKWGPQHLRTLGCMQDLAIVYSSEGRHDQALAMDEDLYRLSKAKLGADHPDTLSRLRNLASEYVNVGKPEQALSLREEALVLAKAKWGPGNPTTLKFMHDLGASYLFAGKPDRAVSLLEEAVKLQKATLGQEISPTMVTLAWAYQEVGKHDQAVSILEADRKLIRANQKQHSLGDLEIVVRHLASAYTLAGKPDKAVRLLEEEMTEVEWGHPGDGYRYNCVNRLAEAYRASGTPDKALSLLEETFRLTKNRLGADDGRTLQVITWVAFHHQKSGKLDRALPLLEEALKLAKAKRGPEDGSTYTLLYNLAGAYLAAKKYDGVLRLCQEMLITQRRKEQADSLWLATVLAQVAQYFSQAGRVTEAEPLLRECLAIRQKKQPYDWETFETQSQLGDVLLSQKKYAEAEPFLLQGYDGLQQRKNFIYDINRSSLTEAAERLVRLYEATNQPEKARTWREKLRSDKRPGN
jgi:serine/threonine protein kinase/tetratricopeptide (TPR) repeat protein